MKRHLLRNHRRWWQIAGLLLCCAVLPVLAQEKPAENGAAPDANAPAAEAPPANVLPATVTVKLVTDFESATLVSDLERIEEIKDTVYGSGGDDEQIRGTKATLWVRNAHIDGKFFFERYYQGKYIGRQSTVDIEGAQLGVGEHTLEPGGHKFTLTAEGKLTSDDPEIRIDGQTVLLRMHKVDIYSVDGAKTGPAEFRKVPATLGLFRFAPDQTLDAAALPSPSKLFNPLKPPKENEPVPPLTNLLSEQGLFYPLSVWLPANTAGQGYLLYPSWQAFHLTPAGEVKLAAADAPQVAGVTAEEAEIVIPYREVQGRIRSRTGLSGGVGTERISKEMRMGATLEPQRFRAGLGAAPPEDFFLTVDNDLTNRPHKFFVADNTIGPPEQVRLLAVEWDEPIFARAQEANISVRLLESAGQEPLANPEVRMDYSLYNPSQPTSRNWLPVKVVSWNRDPQSGELVFQTPEVPFGFVVIRLQIFAAGDTHPFSPLAAEMFGSVIEPNQQGTASFVSNKGRSAFVAGETIRLEAVLRSTDARPAGERQIQLTYPSGHQETLACPDSGEAWLAQAIELPAEKTRRLPPGEYQLSMSGLPAGIVSVPFTFELTGRQPKSLFHVVKPSKYTRAMNDLESSHLNGKPVDLDRAISTLARLGYTRVDLMTYSTRRNLRAFTWREDLAAGDPRLPPPEAVFAPAPRDQILNACVREGMQYSDVVISYNDFHLPRSIEPYIQASERWIASETQAMRHSPAFDGIMLYDEMYQQAVTGIVPHHQKYFAKVRSQLVEEKFGQTPAKIEAAMNRYLSRPRSQRDPAALEDFIAYRNWQQESWGEYIDRVVHVARDLAPGTRYGTYHRTWLSPGTNDDMYNGYPPRLFKNLDIISHVHYADNSTCWVSIPLLAQALRSGEGKTLYVNLPLTHEVRTEQDGQYQRHMAFALLQQGANGISHWGLQHSFDDGPNPGTAQGYETTRHLNQEILQPFGEINDRTTDGYGQVGIVSLMREHALSEHKRIAVANQTEAIWIACWRLGYPAVFVREEQMEQPLSSYRVLFVPGVRMDGEIDEPTKARLAEAMAAGTKVVVEADSTLELPGVLKLDDWQLHNYFVGTYFPTWQDDELNKVYEKSQATVDYLGPKFVEWGIEPAGRGPFEVGPTWRDGGEIDYLWMANFADPAYRHTVKQQMAQPVEVPLVVPARHGRVAYDLLAHSELPLTPQGEAADSELKLTLDMRRMQGALVAFTPEPIAQLQVEHALSQDGGLIKLKADLIGETGKKLDAVFPVQITLSTEGNTREFFRVLGRDLAFDLDLPAGPADGQFKLQVRESIAGHTVELTPPVPIVTGNAMQLPESKAPYVPRPQELASFREQAQAAGEVKIVPAVKVPGAEEGARRLADGLQKLGIKATVVEEAEAYYSPQGNPNSEDPLGDGFHSWRMPQSILGPEAAVDGHVVLLGAPRASVLIDMLARHGLLSEQPLAGVGRRSQPQILRAARGLHFAYDTLAIVAGDAAGFEQSVDYLMNAWPKENAAQPKTKANEQAATASPDYSRGFPRMPSLATAELAKAEVVTADKVTEKPSPVSFTGTNELVMNAQYDQQGNSYLITWGHGKNLYSFTPQGELRFARYVPEVGPIRLEMLEDRLLVYTSGGARLYELGLDGTPRKQVRLNLDPGGTHYSDNYQFSRVDYAYLPEQKLFLHNLGEQMRVLDEEFNLLHQWSAETFVDKDVDDKILSRELFGYAVSPDGKFVAQIEASYYFARISYQDVKVYDTHLVIRDLEGKLLAEHKDLDNRDTQGKPGVVAKLSWPEGSAGPQMVVQGERLTFNEKLEIVDRLPLVPGDYSLGGERRLVRDGQTLLYFDKDNHSQCRIGPLATMPTYVRLSPDQSLLALLDEYGRLEVYQTSDGQPRMKLEVPERGRVLRFSPDGKQLLLAGMRGGITAYDLEGNIQWRTRLETHNDILGEENSLYDPAFKDYTSKLWPISRDEAGELDALVRMGENRLVGGDCESDGGWQGEQVAFAGPGFESGRALRVGPSMVGQEVTQYLGNHVTWVMEFRYRAAETSTVSAETEESDSEAKASAESVSGGPQPELLAGIMSDCDFPDSTARTFTATGDWQFGRVVIKNGAGCKRLLVGFSAGEGDVLVDQVSLRRLRFPSVNHLLYEPLYPVKPVVLDSPFFSEQYDPYGNVREEAPNRVLVESIRTGALNLLESAFLQNGRTSEISSQWYIQPLDHDPTISLGLRDARWISMVGLYFNVHDEANVTPHFDIYATDMETREEKLLASVRHNGQLFRLIKFPPIKTSLVKIVLVNSISRLRTVTEIELYGPLSGREGTPGFVDSDGQNTYLGDFSRVDKRVKQLADWYNKPLTRTGGHDVEIIWHAPLAQVLAAENKLYFGRTLGVNSAVTLEDPAKDLYFARSGGLGYTPYGALYGGLIFRCGNDGQLYCLDPVSGTQLWTVKLGERLFGCPVAIGEDLYVTSDTGMLYEIDFAGGSIMKETSISGKVFGSLATDGTHLFFITDDGFLHCIQASNFETLWKSPVARFTDSTPVVDGGFVYLADQRGTARAIRVSDGGEVWKFELEDEFMRAPVVGPDRIVFGCRGGTLAVLDRADGTLVWKKQVKSRFFYEPMLLHSAGKSVSPEDYGGDLLLYFEGARALLAKIADGTETEFTFGGISADRKPTSPTVPEEKLVLPNEPVAPLTFYQGTLVALPRTDHDGYHVVYPWHVQGGQYTVLKPVPPLEVEPAAAEK